MKGSPMAVRIPRLSKEEHARRGNDLYENRIRRQVEKGNFGKIVAIDVDSGEFEVADEGLVAAERLLARYPEAQIWLVRIGHRGVHQLRRRLEMEVIEDGGVLITPLG